MPRCIIDNCTSVYDNIKERRHLFFNAPKDQGALKLWQKIVNRPNFVVKPHHLVCEKHFRKEDIMWRREIKDQNGVVIGVSPYKLPRLRKGVIPSLYMGNNTKFEDLRSESSMIHPKLINPDNLNMKECGRRRDCDSTNEDITITCRPDLSYRNFANESTESQPENAIELRKDVCENVMILSPDLPAVPMNSTSQELSLNDILHDDSIEVPPSWIKYSITNENESVLVFNENIFKTNENGLKTVVLKEIIVDEQLCIHVNILNERINTELLRCPNKLNSINELQEIVNLIYKLDICKGYCTSKNIDYTAVYVDPLNTYRHVKCLLLTANEPRCKFCYE